MNIPGLDLAAAEDDDDGGGYINPSSLASFPLEPVAALELLGRP